MKVQHSMFMGKTTYGVKQPIPVVIVIDFENLTHHLCKKLQYVDTTL